LPTALRISLEKDQLKEENTSSHWTIVKFDLPLNNTPLLFVDGIEVKPYFPSY
jgi:hypothetical protein